MLSPQMATQPLKDLEQNGWRRIFVLQQLVNKELERIPHNGESPPSVENRELHEIIFNLPIEFIDYVLLLPARGSNPWIYNTRLVAILALIVTARRLEAPLEDQEILMLLNHAD